MKNKIVLILSTIAVMLSILSIDSQAGTCTTISRTNFNSNSILTSTELNSQLNNIYAPFNSATGAADGGCITDGTLEAAALNATEFAASNNGVQRGCKVTRSDSNTMAVGNCVMTLGGNQIRTTASNTVTWTDNGGTAEAASTLYYIFAKAASTGTTLTLMMSTSAPNADGLDSSGNAVLGTVWNTSNSDIASSAVGNWTTNGYEYNGYPSSIRVATANGWGSTDTKIRILTTVNEIIGDDIVRTTSAANGDKYTVGTSAEYCGSYTDNMGAADRNGISLNSSQLTTSIQSITQTDIVVMGRVQAANVPNPVYWCRWLEAGDIIRMHTQAVVAGTNADVRFEMWRVK